MVKPEIILKAATIIIKDKIINITFLSTFKAEKSDLLEELAHRREQSKQYIAEIKHLTEEHSKLMEFLVEQKQQIELQAKDGEDLRNELERLQTHRNVLEQSNQEIATELERMQELHKQERAEHSKLVETISALESEVTVLRTERQDFLDQRDRLRGELNAIQSRFIYRFYKGIKRTFGGRG